MSDTPETDAAEWSWDDDCTPENEMIVASDFARKLERERDEWREAWYEMHSSFERSRDEVEQLIRERDEARAALREFWQSADAFLPNFDAETIARWRKAAGWEGEE